MFNSENFIAVDWGSSNLRLWVYQKGSCVWRHASHDGVINHHAGQFKDIWLTLLEQCPHTLADNTTVIMSGMIGSNIGWVDSHYLLCPVSLRTLSQHLTQVHDAGHLPVFIIPGLQLAGSETCNVMRGEETQLLGALSENSWYAFPGTHSKWVRMENDTVRDFQTIMTGEFFHLLTRHSIVGKHATVQQHNVDAFLAGAKRGQHENCLSRGVFDLRARTLSHILPQDALFDALSGLLIGHEIAQMLQHYAIPAHEEIVLVGSDELLVRYQTVFQLFGQRCRLLNGETAFINGIRSVLHEHP
ncbi:TPA: 2-dehydro-3-deoxygalactonokinase [Citrobacter koseri]|uniref:2-dehydro-3-deoxygalactonokinase n=1 Tax=Citrobacter koseri TaxID=545 RepID=UPI0010200DCC|nr:2-dehydro-3-deoxygalactonokinase [Citrobacter koseri]RZA62090.1 2-dehydro-3-deoxygalactonokinase [Citrobacter koseri]HCR9767768.1 2-dehydro-3-deoxygalactonokinase [Citrobacter koseri]HEM7950398.1 2-dehydro-3-deoxygalactonokinase [Citrobacter koseri]